MALFRRKRTQTLEVRLNARLMPMDRGELFEDPLDEHLRAASMAVEVTGGGTSVSDEGEPLSCDLELEYSGVERDALAQEIGTYLDSLGAPRGSSVVADGGTVLTTFGVTEGLALYLNGTDLPDEVYAASDTNELVDAITQALAGSGRMLSYWHGPEETALYLYGPSTDVMRDRLSGLLATRPDTQLSRLEIIT